MKSHCKKQVTLGVCWAFIPARGGSKSIPLKNLSQLSGRPLLDYVIRAARESGVVEKIICSTDHSQIAQCAEESGAEIHHRSQKLSGDAVSTVAVIEGFLQDAKKSGLPEMLLLLEPTSPFVKSEQIIQAVAKLKGDPSVDSVQTVSQPPPNHHAYNQRIMDGERLSFRFAKLRKGLFNKQLKPQFYIHGNLRVFRVASFLKYGDIFGKRSLGIEIPFLDAMDVDGLLELQIAEALLQAGLVEKSAGNF